MKEESSESEEELSGSEENSEKSTDAELCDRASVIEEEQATTTAIKGPLKIAGKYKSKLGQDIVKEYNNLVEMVAKVPESQRKTKGMTLSSASASVADLIAYQIGWGKLVIGWYDVGVVEGKTPEMPGEGFKTWNYKGLMLHFFKKWPFDSGKKQMQEFHAVVTRLLEIVEAEHKTGNLDAEGVWAWCQLQSGKEWPLSKWVRVNTAAPYNRAAKLINGFRK